MFRWVFQLEHVVDKPTSICSLRTLTEPPFPDLIADHPLVLPLLELADLQIRES